MRLSTLILSGFLWIPACAFAAPPQDGLLDPTFSGDGKTRLSFDQGGNNIDLPYNVVATPTGAYVFGSVETGIASSVTTITRLKLDGSVDTSGYGDQGTVYVDMLDGFYDDYKLANGALQADGKLVAIGQATNGNDTDMLVCRFLTNGALDENFGDEGGCKRIEFENIADDICFGICHESAQAIAIQSNQRIVIAAAYDAPANSNALIVAARLNTAGAYDPGFTHPSLNNVPGRALIDVSDFGSSVARIVVDDNERIMIGYNRSNDAAGCDYGFAIKRILPNGGTDNSFNGGTSRVIEFDLGGFTSGNGCLNYRDRLADMTLLDDGSILLGGEAEVTSAGDDYVPDFMGAIVKITPTGTVDTGWGNQGKRTIRACDFCGNARYTGFAVQANGKMLLTGQTIAPLAPNDTTDAFAIRFLPDGMVDTSFGDGSLLGQPGRGSYGFNDNPNGTNELQVRMTLQNDRPLLLTTVMPHSSFNTDFGLFRLRDDRIFWNGLELD